MLDFIGTVLEYLFAYGIPAIVALVCIVAFFVFCVGLFNINRIVEKDKVFLAGIIVICSFAFFMYWLPELQSQKQVVETDTGNLLVSSTVAAFILLASVFFARFLKFVSIPYIITFIVYLGILIFGF